LIDHRRQTKILSDLEASGMTRRSERVREANR
jgi:hypothetical protein